MSIYTGISRSLNNRHWVSDILAGVGLGVFSAELSYLIVDAFYKNKGDYFSPFDVKNELDNPSFVSVKLGQSFYIDDRSQLVDPLLGCICRRVCGEMDFASKEIEQNVPFGLSTAIHFPLLN